MRRVLLGIVLALLASAIGAGNAAAATRTAFGCLRPGAPSQLTLLAQAPKGDPVAQLFNASPSGANQIASGALGDLYSCPDAAGAGDTTAIAGVTLEDSGFHAKIRAAVRSGAGPFGAPVDLESFSIDEVIPADPHVTVGPRGDVAVIWFDYLLNGPDEDVSTLVRIARRPAGGQFGPAETIASIQSQDDVNGIPVVAAGIDESGTTTALWSEPLPDLTGGSEDAVMRTTSAPAGGGFGPVHRISSRVESPSGVALAVAPDGHAVAAWTGTEGVSTTERATPAGDFSPARELVSTADPDFARTQFAAPAASLGADGTALVTWVSFGDDRLATEATWHGPGGDFVAPQRVWSEAAPAEPNDSGNVIERAAPRRMALPRQHAFDALGVSSPEITFSPSPLAERLPEDVVPPRALVSSGGRLTLTWLLPLQSGSDQMPAAWTASGTTDGGFTRGHRVSGDCRPAEGIVPFSSASDPLVAWTDNATAFDDSFSERPIGDGRLHVQTTDQTLPSIAPPIKLAAVAAPSSQAVYFDEPVDIDASCDRACDLRAWVPGKDGTGPVAATVATLERSGCVRIGLLGTNRSQLAPSKPGPITIRVRACDASGLAEASTSVSVRLARRPIPRLARLLHVRARRSGSHATVTWRTDRPAKRQDFIVAASSNRLDEIPFDSNELTVLRGSGKRSFKARVPADTKRFVTIFIIARDPPNRQRSVTVRIR